MADAEVSGRLVECVPNVSEGRDQDTLDALAAAAAARAGSWLLDHTADIDHGRAVYTLAGHDGPVMDAVEAMVEVAVERIDMRRHRGRHPRIGAVDVIPFVPLDGITLAECVASSRSFAARIAQRFSLPVYLYGGGATRPRSLAELRRPGFEGLARAMAAPDGKPDFGPARPHPTAGATAVGVRPFLVAFNVQLATTDADVARRMAVAMRERDGGLAAVQAIGISLPSMGCVQLSMNLVDHHRTPLWRVWDEALRLSTREGVDVIDSELIGLVPAAALLAVADHIGSDPSAAMELRLRDAGSWLRIRGFDPGMALEVRLARVRGAGARGGGSG